MPYICYLITNGSKTYVGITNNIKRRLRQHCGLIKGGAKYTTRNNKTPWELVAFAYGFRNKSEALSFEWFVHHKKPRWKYIGSVSKRLQCFDLVFGFSKFQHIQGYHVLE